MKFQKDETNFQTLVAVNIFLSRGGNLLPLPIFSLFIFVTKIVNAHTKLFKCVKLWSYHDGTGTDPDNGYICMYIYRYVCIPAAIYGSCLCWRGSGVGGPLGARPVRARVSILNRVFVFVRYSFVDRLLNIYLWGIRQPVVRLGLLLLPSTSTLLPILTATSWIANIWTDSLLTVAL